MTNPQEDAEGEKHVGQNGFSQEGDLYGKMSLVSFQVETSGHHLWNTLSKYEYGNRMHQAAKELLDNAISAILTILGSSLAVGRILFDFNDVTNMASIEDNGPGFPSDPEELKRCWSYGFPNPGGLNEHGCGAKTALSIFDVKGDGWKVYWKNQDSPTIYMIQGPLQRTMEVTQETTWPGKLNDPSGVYMSFPCSKECFRSLYGRGAKKMEDAIPRFKRELAQTYYYRPEIASKKILLEVNGEVVEPFTIDFGTVQSHCKFDLSLGEKNKLHGVCIQLKEEIKNSWFKATQSAMGIYIWKEGRNISFINSGELFEAITGRKPHPSMAGKILLVNMVGDQTTLPPTDPNKTTWRKHSESFGEFLRQLSTIATPFFGGNKEEDYERDLVKDYVENKRIHLGRHIPGYMCNPNVTIHNETPPIDIVEEFPGDHKVVIYEAKRDTQASLAHISQLLANYILAKNAIASSSRTITKAILLLNCDTETAPMDPKLESQVRVLMEDSKLPLEIHSYKDELLWPAPVPAPVSNPKRKVKTSKASGTV